MLMILIALACAPREPSEDEPMVREPETVVIHVRNHNTLQATVYIREDGGMRARLGEVPSQTDRFFERDVWRGQSIRFDIRILARRTFQTDAIVVVPGDTIQVTVPARL